VTVSSAVNSASKEETLPAPADVPVGQHVQVAAQFVAGARDVVGVQLCRQVPDQLAGVGQKVLVQRVGVTVIAEPGVVAAAAGSGVRVKREEAVHVPQRQDDLADAVADSLLGDHQVAAAQDGAGHEEPAHGV
jgi:hypothetical protein